jgi:Ion channel
MLIFLCAILMLLVFFPFMQRKLSDYIIFMELFFCLLLMAGINIVSQNKKIVTTAILIAILAIVVIWFDYILQSRRLLIFGLTLEILFFILTTITIITHVLKYKKVTEDKIYGAVCGYLLIGIIWAMIYTTLEIAFPNSFAFTTGITLNVSDLSSHRVYFTQFVYYSYVTLSTLGYGDIVPVSHEARAFSSLEAVIGQLYVAVLIARLVGLHISHSHFNR